MRLDGGLDYDPEAGFEGVDRFAYKLRDGDVYSAPVEPSVTVRSHLDVAHADSAPLIDGIPDAAGTKAARQPLNRPIAGTGHADFSATFRPLWDAQHFLYASGSQRYDANDGLPEANGGR